ncbi:MAG: DUF6502 family protein [Steroidobacteraceae bacterium]
MPRSLPLEAPDAVELRDSLQALLDALAPLLLRARITPAMVTQQLRLASVRAAAANARMATGRVNHSLVATLTGLSRLEVRRLLAGGRGSGATSVRQLDRAARVLDGWGRDPAYRGARGRPRALPLRGPAPSFETLVQRYGGDVPPLAVQRELERAAAVRVSRGRIRPVAGARTMPSDEVPHPLPGLAPYVAAVLAALEPQHARVEWAHRIQIPVRGGLEATLATDRARRTLAAAVNALRPSATDPRPDATGRRAAASPPSATVAQHVEITLIMTRPPTEDPS